MKEDGQRWQFEPQTWWSEEEEVNNWDFVLLLPCFPPTGRCSIHLPINFFHLLNNWDFARPPFHQPAGWCIHLLHLLNNLLCMHSHTHAHA